MRWRTSDWSSWGCSSRRWAASSQADSQRSASGRPRPSCGGIWRWRTLCQVWWSPSAAARSRCPGSQSYSGHSARSTGNHSETPEMTNNVLFPKPPNYLFYFLLSFYPPVLTPEKKDFLRWWCCERGHSVLKSKSFPNTGLLNVVLSKFWCKSEM